MTQFLIVPAGQENSFSGGFCPGKAIAPRPLQDGRSILPTRLLEIPECVTAFPGLTALSIEEVTPDQFLQEE
ncbi:MAG: hypothetical protein RIC87_08005 [Kiloniellales bacterium]